MSIYKACDIRGKFGSELTVEHAGRLADALVSLRGAGTVLVGSDGRTSTPLLKSTLVERLVARGCAVIDIGMVPTPVFYFARERLGVEVGVMVTASHNPAGDNGFKVTPGPLPISPEEMEALAQKMESPEAGAPLAKAAGRLQSRDLLPEYVAHARRLAPDLSGLKVVVDCGSGMAGLVARQVWEKTRAEVILLLEEVDGRFPEHAPNPAEARNLALLQRTVLERKADLGIAYDGDGDRVAFVDGQGQVVPNDKVIVLFARDCLRQGPETIVYDQKCSRIVPDTIRRWQGTPVMQLSGHTFIKRSFLELDAAYAGELSGHHFFRSLGGDDGLLASILFANIVKESGETLAQLVEAIPSYPITPDLRLPMSPASVQEVMDSLETRLGQEARISKTDGLRIEFEGGWALVRPSVTEPVITIRAEGTDKAWLQRILKRLETAAPQLHGKLLESA